MKSKPKAKTEHDNCDGKKKKKKKRPLAIKQGFWLRKEKGKKISVKAASKMRKLKYYVYLQPSIIPNRWDMQPRASERKYVPAEKWPNLACGWELAGLFELQRNTTHKLIHTPGICASLSVTRSLPSLHVAIGQTKVCVTHSGEVRQVDDTDCMQAGTHTQDLKPPRRGAENEACCASPLDRNRHWAKLSGRPRVSVVCGHSWSW